MAHTNKRREAFNAAIQSNYDGPAKYNTKGATTEFWLNIVRELNPTHPILHRDIPEEQPQQQPEQQELIHRNNEDIKSVDFPLYPILGDNLLTQDNVDAVKEYVSDCLDNVMSTTGFVNAMYKVAISSNYYTFSTPFMLHTADILANVNQKLDDYSRDYTRTNQQVDQHLEIDKVSIVYWINAKGLVRGANKSIQEANERWYMPTNKTKTNCFFIALFTCMKWDKKREFLTDPNKRRKNGEMLKNDKKLNLPAHLKDGVSRADFEFIATKFHIHLKIYNNLYELEYEYKRGTQLVEIKVADDHATPLIPKKLIIEKYPDFQFDQPLNYNPQQQLTKKIFKTNQALTHDTHYAVMDFETYTITKEHPQRYQKGADKELVVYMSGIAFHEDFDPNKKIIVKQFFGDKDNLKQFTQYIKDNIDFFHNCTIYAHNGGKFDLILLLRDALLQDQDIAIDSKSLLEQGNSIIGLTIINKTKKLHFKDSYKLFQASLAKIAKEFKVATQKGHLDHHLMNAITIHEHRDQIHEYHYADCEGLLQCVDIFSKHAFDTFKINITNCYTAASFSKRIVKTQYLRSKRGLYRLSSTEDLYIRRGYQGGRNECFAIGRIQGNHFYYYDYTSLYPFVGLNYLPVGFPQFQDYTNTTIKQALSMNKMGFIRCLVTGTSEMLNNRTPVHGLHKDSRFIFPYINTPTELVLFTEEIRYGLNRGYHYTPLDGYKFDREKPMADFFTDCTRYKQEARSRGDDALCAMWKIINNSGYGFWGYNPSNHDTIKMYNRGSRGYLAHLSQERLKAINKVHGYTFARVLNEKQSSDTNVAIAAAITSYARIQLHNAISDIQDAGGNVYYCDTDSIISDLKLSDHTELLRKLRPDLTGDSLGSLKNELGLTRRENPDGSFTAEDLHFDELLIAGCKMYSISGFDKNGQRVEINKLKGYKKEIDQNEKIIHTADRETINKMVNGEVVSQTQSQLLCNKSDYLRNGSEFQIRSTNITKQFVSKYTKGTLQPHGDYHLVIPLTI